MRQYERWTEIMIILCRRKSITATELAQEFGVSVRTIMRDINSLSLVEPIYTKSGKNGGIFVDKDYSLQRMYMTTEELAVLHKLSELAHSKEPCLVDEKDISLLDSIIDNYTKPKIPPNDN